MLDCNLDVFAQVVRLGYKKLCFRCVKLYSRCLLSAEAQSVLPFETHFFLIYLHIVSRFIFPERHAQVRLPPENKFVWGRKNWLAGVLTFP